MGIIKATIDALGGALADQWAEVIEADNMSDTTVFCKGVKVRPNDRRGGNKKGTEDTISNGSVIHVYPGQFMMLVDGGKIVDFTAEEGYYKVDNSSAPSLFAGQFGKAFVDAFQRVKFGGVPSYKQKAYFVNLQEIKGIKFGTRTPVNYFDTFYNAELFLRAHGTYSIRITDPVKFYTEVVPKNVDRVEISSVNEQYLSEFLEGLQASINRMSADGIRISFVASKSQELSRYMASELDAGWKESRGFEIQSVGIASISYDDESKELINLRNQGAMLSDPSVREGYVQGAIARGLEQAGSNPQGATNAYFGMGMGMNGTAGFMGSASQTNREQMAREAEMRERQAQAQAQAQEGAWTCECGAKNTGKFCSECGKKKPEAKGSWTCSCGTTCTGKFCPECGSPKPATSWFCTECGHENGANAKFCAECGKPRA